MTPATAEWQKTACILCSENCGLEVAVDDAGRFARIRGDKAHPSSRGYLCQKASRLDFYQNNADRLRAPLRRRADGSFEEISWETAIGEVAAALTRLRDAHGGHSLAYMGGGGQGNHLGGIYGAALKKAMRTRYHYSSLAQEKTGGFWNNGHLFGRQTCYPGHDVEHADFIMFLGTNPWQSHGIARARQFLLEISKDPKRKMVVVDPWRTETAELADVHLAVKPGRDAFLLSAMLGIIFQEGLQDKAFLAEHAVGADRIAEQFSRIPVEKFCRHAGLDPEVVRVVTREYAAAEKATIRADLGLEHTLHSTLNDYLGKLLFLVTGHFGRAGCNNLKAQFLPLLAHSGDSSGESGKYWKTRATGAPEISHLFPPNVLPREIESEREDRIRGVFVDSMNPIMTGADTRAYRRAFAKLELLIVVDVAMTETARLAHYILPACTQYEKWEAAFFGSGVPSHTFQLRAPIMDRPEGTLSEPEIYSRLLRAMGETPATSPLLGAVAQVDALAPQYRSLGDNFKMVAAPIFLGCQTFASKHSAAVQRAGISDSGAGLGAALFEKVAASRSGVEIARFDYDETWAFIRHPDGKIRLAIDELLPWVDSLEGEMERSSAEEAEFPFMLSAGGRRSYNANQIMRDPKWRRDDSEGALWMHPEDMNELGISSGAAVAVESRRGRITVRAEASERAQRGFANLPHGYGMGYAGAEDGSAVSGPAVNLLTDADYCDPIARTPYHKNVRVRILPAAG